MGRPLHILIQTIDAQAHAIFSLAKYSESGIALCYPGCGIDYNLLAYLDTPTILKKHLGPYYKKHIFIPVFLTREDTKESVLMRVKQWVNEHLSLVCQNPSFESVCSSIIDSGREPYFFFFHSQDMRKNRLQELLDSLDPTILHLSGAGSLFFFEENIHTPKFEKLFSPYRALWQNELIFPVYSLEESIHFVHTIAKQWHLPISDRTAHAISLSCGGYLWLLKEAVRYLRVHPTVSTDNVVNHPLIQKKVQIVMERFTDEEKYTLATLCFGNSFDSNGSEKQYFVMTRVVEELPNGTYRLTCQLMEQFLKPIVSSSTVTIDPHGNIRYNQKNITNYFSFSEQTIMKLLISHRGTIVSRDEIAKVLWSSSWEERYSDWAIDKSISRLRKTMDHVGLQKNSLVTKKKQGVLFL